MKVTAGALALFLLKTMAAVSGTEFRDCRANGETNIVTECFNINWDCYYSNDCCIFLRGTDNSNWFVLDQHYKIPDNKCILGEDDGTCDSNFGGCTLKTWIKASKDTGSDACYGNTGKRIGFVLGSNVVIGYFNYVSYDTQRWQQGCGGAACGGGVFETPGCSDAYCSEGYNHCISDSNGSCDGISNAEVKNVKIFGSNADNKDWLGGCHDASVTAPQMAVFINQTPDLNNPSHGITIYQIWMHKSWEDGINIHGSSYDITIDAVDLACTGDDSIGLWSSPDQPLKAITIKNSILSQAETTNGPDPYWGTCIAIYGGGGYGNDRIWIENNYCTTNTINTHAVKFSRYFSYCDNSGYWDMFPQDSNVYITAALDKVATGSLKCTGENYGVASDISQYSTPPDPPTINTCTNHNWITQNLGDCPDPAFIYIGCVKTFKPIKWVDTPNNYGPGWYCGEDKDMSTVPWDELEVACIKPGCNVVEWDGSQWYCEKFKSSGPVRVSGFSLVDADSDEIIGPINDGDSVKTKAFNIIASTVGQPKYIRFEVNGNKKFHYEGVEQYSLCGDYTGMGPNGRDDYIACKYKCGEEWDVKAVPYYIDDEGNTEKGLSLGIKFTVDCDDESYNYDK